MNVVADALSRKSYANEVQVAPMSSELCAEFEQLNLGFVTNAILCEAHESAYSIHPRSTKMYLDLKEKYWWYGLKRDVAEYVALCDTCQSQS